MVNTFIKADGTWSLLCWEIVVLISSALNSKNLTSEISETSKYIILHDLSINMIFYETSFENAIKRASG